MNCEAREDIYSSGWNFETTNFVIDYTRPLLNYGEGKNCAMTFKKLKVTFYVSYLYWCLNVKYAKTAKNF